jgi:hypothetical protein
MNAVFLTGSQHIAAYYAGIDGLVHGFEIDADSSVLKATANVGDNRANERYNYPSVDEWTFLTRFLSVERGIEVKPSTFRSLDRGLAGHVHPPLGPDGQLSWEMLLLELTEVMEDGEALLEAMGFDAIARTELGGWALNDRYGHYLYDGSSFARMCAAMKATPKEEHFVLAMMDTGMLRHRETRTAAEVAQRFILGTLEPPTTEEEMAGLYSSPLIRTPRPRFPSPI